MAEEEVRKVHVEYQTIAEAIGHLYMGKFIQVYLGESGGSTHYADFDIEQKIFVEGKVLWSKGNVFALEVIIPTPNVDHKKTVLINAWSVTSVMEKDNKIDISMVMKGMRR